MIKRLKLESCNCQQNVDQRRNSLSSLMTKFEGGPLDRGAQTRVEGFLTS